MEARGRVLGGEVWVCYHPVENGPCVCLQMSVCSVRRVPGDAARACE